VDWQDVRKKALWTFVESFLGTVIVFLGVLAAAWVDTGAFVIPFAAVVVLAAGAVGAFALALTVVKEWALTKKGTALLLTLALIAALVLMLPGVAYARPGIPTPIGDTLISPLPLKAPGIPLNSYVYVPRGIVLRQ